MSFRSIVVGVGLDARGLEPSAGSRLAAEQAVALVRRGGGKVTLFHSSNEDPAAEPARVRAAVDALAARCDEAGVVVELVWSEQRPWLEMTRRAVRGEHDLVMVSKRRWMGVDGRRVGITTRKLLRKCPCPVWAADPRGGLVGQRVLAATDLAPAGPPVVGIAAELADRLELPLDVVHVWQLTMEQQLELGPLAAAEHAARLAAIEGAIRARVAAQLGGRDATIHLETRISPHDGILCAIERTRPDLLVMGTLGRAGIPGLIVGNTAERLIDLVPCSLLAIKPQGFVSPLARDDG